MSDDRLNGGNGDVSPTDEDGGEVSPGGGPKRVVSERSVDDILESLSETKETETNPASRAVEESSPVLSEVTESAANTEALSDVESDDSQESGDDDGGTDSEDAVPTELSKETDSEPVDEDAFTARIDAGEVTGADVRAAETGEGREPTPEIDEIELTLEDLDEASGGEQATADSEAEKEDESPETPQNEQRTSDGSGGLLARIRGLFSR